MRQIVTGLFILFLSVGSAAAQNYMNVLNPRLYMLPFAGLQNDSRQISFQEWRIESALPAEFKNGNVLGIKPQFKTISLLTNTPDSRDLKLYTFKAPVFAFLKFGESGWSVYADVSPKLNTDLKNIDERHFQIGGMFIFYKERKPGFFWQFGLFYNQDTYGPFVMPLAGIDWKINEKDYFAALIPAYLIYERKISEKLYAGFEMELSGETFRLGDSEYKNSFISQVGENKLTFLTEPRLFLDYYIVRHLVVYAKPGFRFFQKYEHYTEDDKRITDSEFVEGKMENSFYFEVGLALRFRYDEPEN